MAFDPVCKMEVQEAGSPSFQFNGVTFYFCCDACKDTFLKDPSRYLTADASGVQSHYHGGHGHHGHGHNGGCC